MNRFKTRLPALAILAFMAVTGLLTASLNGCSAGQISQMATQEPAVNGNKVTFNNVALRDVHIRATQSSDFIEKGKTVDLVLVAVNQSPDITDRLVSITSDVGTVALSGGDGRLPAGGMLFVGTPDGQKVAPGPTDSNNAAKATVTLAQPITNGLNYNFTFNFEKAGQASVLVPISAGVASHES
jgi:hypothetical protein